MIQVEPQGNFFVCYEEIPCEGLSRFGQEQHPGRYETNYGVDSVSNGYGFRCAPMVAGA